MKCKNAYTCIIICKCVYVLSMLEILSDFNTPMCVHTEDFSSSICERMVIPLKVINLAFQYKIGPTLPLSAYM